MNPDVVQWLDERLPGDPPHWEVRQPLFYGITPTLIIIYSTLRVLVPPVSIHTSNIIAEYTQSSSSCVIGVRQIKPGSTVLAVIDVEVQWGQTSTKQSEMAGWGWKTWKHRSELDPRWSVEVAEIGPLQTSHRTLDGNLIDGAYTDVQKKRLEKNIS